jgi:hypothetical protein
MGILNRGAKVFQNSRGHVKILYARRVAYAEYPRIVCAAVQNLGHHGGLVPASCTILV